MRSIDADLLKKEMWSDYYINDMYYPNSHEDTLRIVSNIIDSLPTVDGKAQEPRVMTVHDWEANHTGKMPVWVEWSESAKGECADYEKADGWAVLNADEFVDVLCFGGRCWTSRPTEEQREAVECLKLPQE